MELFQSRKKESMEERLLKPPLQPAGSSNKQLDETWRRRSSRRLDLDAPLLSVRRNRALPLDRQEPPYPPPPLPLPLPDLSKPHRSSGSFGTSRRTLVPFFVWEQVDSSSSRAIIPVDETLPPHKEELVLRPPPVHNQQQQGFSSSRLGRRNVESSDVRSEFAHTEAPSLAPTYVVSQVYGDDTDDDHEEVVEEEDEEDERLDKAVTEYNAEDRGDILRRFLPAAKEVAEEMSSRLYEQQGDSWRPMIFHPSPQQLLHRTRRSTATATAATPPPKKSFGELINMQHEEESEETEAEEESRRSCQVVGDTVCGFFPLLRMIQAGNSGGSSKVKKPVRSSRAALRKGKPKSAARRTMESPRKSQAQEEEFWSDQGGGLGGEEEVESPDAPQMYMACRYTPSRGGLKPPAVMMESKGFLGMPRDRSGITYIKRMYPVNLNVDVKGGSMETRSVSSDSLSSIKLDNSKQPASGGNSRQSSSGGMEKVFCLDTLNQVREGGGGGNFGSGEEKLVSVESEEMLYYSSGKTRRRMERSSQQVMVSLGKREEEEEEGEEEEELTMNELRICWHEDDNAVVIPTPRGPSHSWLKEQQQQQQKKKLAQASLRKPPLAAKRMELVKMALFK